MISNRVAFGEALTSAAKADSRIVLVDADMFKSTGTEAMLREVPSQVYSIGIAEQNAMGVAGGLASCGKVAVMPSFAVFTIMRAVEQLRNTVCYSNLNVKAVGTHAGLEIGADGGTHQAIEDIAIARSLPNLTVLVPSTPLQTRSLTHQMLTVPGPFYMRLGRNKTKEFYSQSQAFPIGGSITHGNGKDVTIIACGSMVQVALESQELLLTEGIAARVIDLYSIKPMDQRTIVRAARETRGIVTVEDHSIIGGLGGAICELLCSVYPAPVRRIGVEDRFGIAGNTEELYNAFGLTAEAVVQACRSLL